jgi:hypothetical protein
MSHSRLHEDLFRIVWDGLGQYRSLDVPLLFPRVARISAKAFSFNVPPRAELADKPLVSVHGRGRFLDPRLDLRLGRSQSLWERGWL